MPCRISLRRQTENYADRTFTCKCIPASLAALPSTGITRRLQSYGPLPPTLAARPVALTGFRLVRAHHRHGFPCCVHPHACRRYPGGTGQCARRSLPSRWQPSPFYRRVGFRITRFEACSAFTKVAARMLAEPPMAALLIGVLQTTSLPPSPAPTATGWSDSCRAGFAPAEGRRLRTAHGEVGLSRTLGLAIAHYLLTPPTGAEQQHRASPLTPTGSSLPRHRSCTGPTLAGSKLHHDDRDISALGPPVTDRPASMPILLRQRRSVGCFTFPPAKSDEPELPLCDHERS